MEFKHTQLDNGLTIIGEVNPAAKSVALGFFVKTGSRDETPEVSGVSHFLEHMMFKGTDRRSALDVNREFDQLGASYNAFTSEENTVYYGTVLPEFQGQLMDIWSDLMRPALRQEDFSMEKGVICDEIARYEDMPTFRVYEKLMGEHFKGHKLSQNVLGSAASIQSMKRDDMQGYFDRRYSPGNVTLVGVGNLDFDAMVADASEKCAHWTPFDVTRELVDCAGTKTRGTIVDPNVTREHIAMMSSAPDAQSSKRYAAQLLASVVGDSTGSRLFYALVDPALADEATMSYDMLDGTGAMLTFISTDPDRGADCTRIALDEFRKVMEEGITETELQAAKNKIASAATLKGEVPMGRLTAVGFDWVYRLEYASLEDQIEQLYAVTAGDVLQVARQHDLTAVTVLGLGPAEKI